MKQIEKKDIQKMREKDERKLILEEHK